MSILLNSFAAVLGVCWGLGVGVAISAIVTALRIMPRMAQVLRARNAHRHYENALLLGASLASVLLWYNSIRFSLPNAVAAIVGLASGLWVGFLAAALAEVISVLPVAGRRMQLGAKVALLVAAVAAGKILGSLIFWRFPGLWPYR